MMKILWLFFFTLFTFQYFFPALSLNDEVVTLTSLQSKERASMPVMFVESFFEPFYEDGVQELNRVKKEGIKDYVCHKVCDLIEHVKEQDPLNIVFDTASIAIMAGTDNSIINFVYLSGKLKKILKKKFQDPLEFAMNIYTCWLAFDNVVANISPPQVLGHKCFVPGGSWKETCGNFTISSDLNPNPVTSRLCKLETHCSTVIPCIPPTKNIYKFSSDHRYLKLKNRNGTLVKFK